MVGQSTQEPNSACFSGRSIWVVTSMSKQHPFFSRRFFGSHNCKLTLYVTGMLKKVFSSILDLLGPFCSCVLLVKHQRFLESNFANNSNDKTTFVAVPEYCRKARKLVFAVFIWQLSSIFDPGLFVLIGQ